MSLWRLFTLVSTLHNRNIATEREKHNSRKDQFFPLCRFTVIIGTLRSNNVTPTRTSLKKWICVRLVFIAIIAIPTYFVKCRRALLKLNFKRPYPSSEREVIFRRCLFTPSITRKVRYFHVVVVQKQERNRQKSVMHVRSCCFGYNTHCFFDVLVAVRVVGS